MTYGVPCLYDESTPLKAEVPPFITWGLAWPGSSPHILSVEKKLAEAVIAEDAAAETKPLRADAQRNRDRLVEVAASVFAERGIDASLEEIARRAGVGIGTLYRHFPTREHLVEVVYRREVEALCAAAGELAARHPSDVALEEWMRRFVDYIATKRGLATSLRCSQPIRRCFPTRRGGSRRPCGNWSRRRWPMAPSAAMSMPPMCCTPCRASIPRPIRRSGVTVRGGWSSC